MGIIIGLKSLIRSLKSKRNPWQQLADSNNLDYVSGTFFNQRTFIYGDYHQHHLVLDTFQQYQGRRGVIYTRLTLFANLAADSNGEKRHLNIQNTLTKFGSIHSKYPLKGWVKAATQGQTVYYEQLGIEEDTEYLQSLFDLLSDVAAIYSDIIAVGGEAISCLQTIITDKKHLLNLVAGQLLQDIAEDTTDRLSYQARDLLCSQCLVSVAAHKVNKITYYGCRICGQSREFIKVWSVAVLDREMALEQMRHGDILRVNWLNRRDLFDFDEVEIVQATDEEVERFAVQVGNDTDQTRRPRYKQIRCSIASDAELSENTMRILRHMFGQVVKKEIALNKVNV